MSKTQRQWIDAFYPEEKYVLVYWPESQKYMDEDWFNGEAILHSDLSACYFIPESKVRLDEQ